MLTVKYISYILIKITNSLPSRQTTQVKHKTRGVGGKNRRQSVRERKTTTISFDSGAAPTLCRLNWNISFHRRFSFNMVAILSSVSWNKKRMVNKKKIAQTCPSAIAKKTQFHTQSKKGGARCQKVGLQSWETRRCLNASETIGNLMPLPWQPDPIQGGEDGWMTANIWQQALLVWPRLGQRWVNWLNRWRCRYQCRH